MIIKDDDCDIEDLEKDDLVDESPVTAMYVICQAHLCRAGRGF